MLDLLCCQQMSVLYYFVFLFSILIGMVVMRYTALLSKETLLQHSIQRTRTEHHTVSVMQNMHNVNPIRKKTQTPLHSIVTAHIR